MRRSNARFHQYVPLLAHVHMYGDAYYYTSNSLGDGISLSAVFWNAMAFRHISITFLSIRPVYHGMIWRANHVSFVMIDDLSACSFHPTGESYVVYHQLLAP